MDPQHDFSVAFRTGDLILPLASGTRELQEERQGNCKKREFERTPRRERERERAREREREKQELQEERQIIELVIKSIIMCVYG